VLGKQENKKGNGDTHGVGLPRRNKRRPETKPTPLVLRNNTNKDLVGIRRPVTTNLKAFPTAIEPVPIMMGENPNTNHRRRLERGERWGCCGKTWND
jgi:hypothetical protein